MLKLTVVTSYPKQGETHSKETVGVASYTKTLLLGLKKLDRNKEINVLAESFTNQSKSDNYQENGIKVNRCWQRNNLCSLLKLFSKISKTQTDDLMLSFEIYMFGSPLFSLIIIISLLVAKLRGINTLTLLHQVPKNFSEIEKNWLKAKILNIAKTILFKLLYLANNKIIVFEKQLTKQFNKQVDIDLKLVTVPHLIPSVNKKSKKIARKKLGWSQDNFYCLYFGYLAPYKGIDWLVDSWPKEKNLELVIAGGVNPNHQQKSAIKKLLNHIKNVADKKGILMPGFIPEDMISDYFSAADVMILPYKSFMSSSGPLSLSLAYQLPVLLSRPLQFYARSTDFKQALEESGLDISDIIFDFNTQSLSRSLKNTVKKRPAFELFSAEMSKHRSLEKVVQKLDLLLAK